MHMDRRRFVASLAAAGLTAARGHTVSGGAVTDDVDILERALRQLHPGLWRYSTASQLSRGFARLRQEFPRAATAAERYRVLSLFLARIRCGHTYANFYNQSSALQGALFSSRNRLPFHFRLLGDRMVVTRDQSGDSRLVPGTEILSIDGRSPAQIVAALMPYARADGHNDAKRRALLEVQGRDRFESFDIFYPLQFSVAPQFVLMARPPGSRQARRIEVAPIDLVARRAAMAHRSASDAATPAWTLSERDGVAILSMPTWSLYDSGWDWRAFLDHAFERIQRSRGLIVDVRGNEGGLDCGHEILARLIDRDLELQGVERRVRFRRTPPDLDPFLDTWDESFRTLGSQAEDIGDGFYRLPAEPEATRIVPKTPRCRAPTIVLIDAQNSSATFQFAQLVQIHRLGRLVGTPSGGNQRGINGGAFFFLRLPASGLEADLPLIGQFPRARRPDAGLTPDMTVGTTAQDIANGRDADLEIALQAI